MLNMMGNHNKERGAMMGRNVMQYVLAELAGGSSEPGPTGTPSPSNLDDAGGAVMRALQGGDVKAFTAALVRFIETMDEIEDAMEDPFDLEVE
jgi:hypothetical protein